MSELEQGIIKIMEALFEINEEKKDEVIKSFSTTNEEDKKQIFNILYEAYQKFEENSKMLLTKMQLINNEVVEYKEQLQADPILDQLD